jgi:hypothetical protein
MNDSDCSEKSKPRHARKCQRALCITNKTNYNSQIIESYKWRAGSWSEVSIAKIRNPKKKAPKG